MRLWQRPFLRLLGVFLSLGLFAWWIFRTVSLPPVLRDLGGVDEAVASAAKPPGQTELFQEKMARLPTPPEDHAPEVAALLQRLRGLPALPYVLEEALTRDKSTPRGEVPPLWSLAETQALEAAQKAYQQAWEPFLNGPVPDWKNFPDSILLFRAQSQPIWIPVKKYEELWNYLPGIPGGRASLENVRFYLAYLRQIRNLGSLRFGREPIPWNMSETIRVADLAANVLEVGVLTQNYSLDNLQDFQKELSPPPTLEDLRLGLESDRSLFSRAADYLASLPGDTPARAGWVRWLRNETLADWFLERAGQPAHTADLVTQLRAGLAQLELLRQKTFLSGAAWRQWLAQNPGAGLAPWLAQGLGGFEEFEAIRMRCLLARSTLTARIALAQGGLPTARRLPDPARPDGFLGIEEVPGGFRVSSAYLRPGDTNAWSVLVPPAPAVSR